MLATPLKILFNFLFKSGIFSDCQKVAKVIAAYKQGDKTVIGNYCPNFTLLLFSEISEKPIGRRIHSFLEKHSILLPTQYSFRPARHFYFFWTT